MSTTRPPGGAPVVAVARHAVPALGLGVVAFLLLPLLAIVPLSFSGTRYLSMPQGELSLLHYRTLFTDEAWLASLVDSLRVALPAATVATAVGLAFCLGAWQRGGRAVRVLQVLTLAPLIVPGIIHAVAFHRALAFAGLHDSIAGTVLVHALKGLPFVVLSVGASLSAVDPASVAVARSCGATPAQALVRVVLPQLRAGLLAGFLFAWVTSWDEIVVTLFITSRAVHTLPRQIWESLFVNLDPVVAALGTLAIGLTLLFVAAVFLRRVAPPA